MGAPIQRGRLPGWRTWARLGAAVLAGALRYTAFPPLGEAQSVWVALVPLLLLARHTPPRAAFRWGWLSGACFWLPSLSWLLRLGETGVPAPVAAAAWLALALCLSLFTALFTVLAAAAYRAIEGPPGARREVLWRRVLLIGVLAALWVGVEWWRSVLATGFPWNALGVSLYENLALIQVAEWGGVAAVSGVVVAVNAGLAWLAVRIAGVYLGGQRARLQLELTAVLALLAACWLYGVGRVRELDAARRDLPVLRVAAVQPNVPQLKKWPPEFAAEILERLSKRMDLVAALPGGVDLVVWPETAVPGFVPEDPATVSFLAAQAAAAGVPLLAGAMEVALPPGADPAAGISVRDLKFYNSVFLVTPEGRFDPSVYRKQHLVPFGEYLPLDETVPWVGRLAPLGFSCAVGTESTVFTVPAGDGGEPVRFSPLICFEDVFASVARRAVRAGARLLVNQTNDAWFDGSAAAVQHMAHSVFRAVENRVPVVRVANTGVTCFIDSSGRIDNTTRDLLRRGGWDGIDCRIEGVAVPGPDGPRTCYTRWGDWTLGLPSGLLAVAWASALAWQSRRAARESGTGRQDGRGDT